MTCFNSLNYFDEKHPIKTLNCHIRRKNHKNKTTYEWSWNIFAASFSFGVLTSLIFAIYFLILSFTSTNSSSKHSGVILNNFYNLPLNGRQQGEYTPNT